MTSLRVSVLLPVFDASATLAACLRSIQRQTETSFECVMVDDGSRDDSLAIAKEAARNDSRFRTVSLPHRGLVSALNAGIEECRGRLIARMDADDIMHRERLSLQRAALEHQPELSAMGCHVRCFPRAELGSGMRSYEQWISTIDSPSRVRAEAFVECPIAHPTLMLRGELLRKLRYRDLGWPEDYDLLLRILENGGEVGVVPRRLLCWRRTKTSLSRVSDVYSHERFTACKAGFLARTFLAAGDRYVLWGFGGTGRALQRALREQGKRPLAIVEVNPRRIGQTIHGAPVIPPQDLPSLFGERLVVSVAGAEARTVIRAELSRMHYREGRDFVCAA